MTDLTLRSTRRQADRSSDPLDLARVLVERLRGGTIDHERVALAAYCGSEAARAVAPTRDWSDAHFREIVPPAGVVLSPADFDRFLSGLSRWQAHPFSAPVRAALAAAEAVYVRWCRVPQYTQQVTDRREREAAVRRALDAVAAWLADPSEERRASVRAAHVESPLPWAYLTSLVECQHPSWRGHTHVWRKGAYVGRDLENLCDAAASAHPSGEPAIREAIQRALVAWALAD